jgi:hypothetical protein
MTRLRTGRYRQTVSWGEKTLPEVGRLRNHFDFETARLSSKCAAPKQPSTNPAAAHLPALLPSFIPLL